MGFTQIFTSIVELFGFIYTSGQMLFSWLSTPLVDTAGGSVTLLGDLASFTPFELIFGPGLLVVLILCLVKFVLPT